MSVVMPSRKRVREPPLRYTEMPPDSSKKFGRGEFTDAEDAQLLAALLKHGPADYVKLAECIPSRNCYQVKQRVAALEKKAQQTLISVRKKNKYGRETFEPRDKVAIDKWIDYLFHLQDKAQIEHGAQEELPVRMLPRCMAYIAKYEEHPAPELCGGVNLKNVYEFLEHMMSGLPSKHLRSADARFLLEALQRLSASLDKVDLGREQSFIFCGRPQWRSKGQTPRTYGVNKQEQGNEDKNVEEMDILDNCKYNPFRVPKEWLRKDFKEP